MIIFPSIPENFDSSGMLCIPETVELPESDGPDSVDAFVQALIEVMSKPVRDLKGGHNG